MVRGLSLAMVASFGLVACGAGTSTGSGITLAAVQELKLNIDTEPNSFDPGQQTYDYEATVGRTAFEALLKPKADLSDVQGAGAASYDVSSDGKTYTFHLRTDRKWSDGKPVVAKDYVYAWKRLLDPRLAAGYADPFFDATVDGAANYGSLDPQKDAAKIPAFLDGLGLSAPDDHTFVVKLQNPAGYFKWVASLWVGAPLRQDVVEKYAQPDGTSTWATKAEQIVSNGAFMISEIAPKDHVSMVPNPNWSGQKPTLTKITYFEISDANQDFAKYQNGEEDQNIVSLDNIQLVQSDPKLSKELTKTPSLSTFWLSFNEKTPPFDNPKVRLAFAQSIDRNQYTQNISKGRDLAATTFIPTGMPGHDETFKDVQKFDATAAKATLAASGVTAAQLNGTHILLRNNTANKQVGEFMVAQVKDNLGVTLVIDLIDSKTVTKKIRKGDFTIYGPDGWGADYPDPQDWYDIFLTGTCHSLQWGCFSDKTYDDTIAKADQTVATDARLKLYNQAGETLVKQAVVAFLYQRRTWSLTKPYVKGLQGTPMDDGEISGDIVGFTGVQIAKH